MTNREFYNALITGTVTLNAGKETETAYPAYENGVLIPELVEFAKAAVEKINAKNLAAKGKPRAKKPNEENEALKAEVTELVEAGTYVTAKVVTTKINEVHPEREEPYPVQKIAAILKALVAEGVFTEKEGVKTGKPKEYTKV